MKIDFCVPVYNEDEIFLSSAERICSFLRSFMPTIDSTLVFIVNGSSPEFIKLVKDFTEQNRPKTACFIIKDGGKGGAIKTYFNASTADILVYMDIDLAVDLQDLPFLVSPVLNSQADLCFGSRLLPESIKTRSWYREISSKAYLFFSRILLHHNFTDLQCGFKAINRKAWQSISPLILDRAWFFDTELVYLAQKMGFRIKEIPVNWSENRYSQRRSKLNVWRESFIFLQKMMALRQRSR